MKHWRRRRQSTGIARDSVLYRAPARRKLRKSAKVRDFEGNGVVSPLGITREEGYLYFVDKSGDVARVKMARRGKKSSKKQELIAKLGIKRKEGYLYYLDRNGDVSQSRMARGQ